MGPKSPRKLQRFMVCKVLQIAIERCGFTADLLATLPCRAHLEEARFVQRVVCQLNQTIYLQMQSLFCCFEANRQTHSLRL